MVLWGFTYPGGDDGFPMVAGALDGTTAASLPFEESCYGEQPRHLDAD